jgi:hypothetical protein
MSDPRDVINNALRSGQARVRINRDQVAVDKTADPVDPPAPVDKTRVSADGLPLPPGSGDGGATGTPMPPDLGEMLRQAIRARQFGL